MSTKPSTVPDLSPLLALEELDQKRRAIKDRLKEIPQRRDHLTAESARLDRSLRDKEQAGAAKEKSLSTFELDLKTSQSQETEKKLKLNSVKTQKEYDAIKSEIDHAHAERGKLEERILLLMDEISELKDLSKREKQSTEARKKELAKEIETVTVDEKNLQAEALALDEQAKAHIQGLPGEILREYTRLRAIFPEERILSKLEMIENTYTCTACNSPVSHQVVINIKRGQSLFRCEICRRLLYL